MAKFDPENHVLFEKPLLRVPQQLMRQTFKASQKLIERETAYIGTAVNNALAGAMAADAGESPDETLKRLDAMIERMQGLKRKLATMHDEERSLVDRSRKRIGHLEELYAIPAVDGPEYERWSRVRLNRLLVDYLVRSGYSATAEVLMARKPDVGDLSDVEVLEQCNSIETSLRNTRATECLAWCQENKAYLRKAKNGLEFDVRLQQYIELVRRGRPQEAIAYSTKYLVPSADTNLPAIMRASGMLVFDPNDDECPYGDLFSSERWNTLADSFVQTYREFHGLPANSLLQIALSAGLSALKTPSCKIGTHSIASLNTSSASLCPICSPELNELAQPLPYAHHVRSSVDPDPVMMPNGRIYGRKLLREFSDKSGAAPGKLREPATGEEWDEDCIRRVFPS
ncbi:CTLH/CRA C-terminal to lish motif domain-containing protein [Dipodascopsis tothii]|uniref:CTLH/CRA C-terminal to lish motif domain-containing protein n=1 Tax=Dipodascopsis tothii TaxID=44089 RepID=UPI0034CFF11F